MSDRNLALVTVAAIGACLVICFVLARPVPQATPAPSTGLLFDGRRALLETQQLARNYPRRVTGEEGALRAAEFLRDSFRGLGLPSHYDDAQMWLSGRRVLLRNVVAWDPGAGEGVVLLLAHYDSQTTSQQAAADNATGTAVLLELARVLHPRPHRRTFVYVATDAEEWGMIGAREFIRRFPAPGGIVAAVSLDYVGHGRAAGIAVSLGGQGSGYAPLWLRQTVAEGIRAAGQRVLMPDTAWEIVERAVRVSFQDQGPLNHWEVPAVNLGVAVADVEAERRMYHSPQDTVDGILPETLAAAGRSAEAIALALDRAPLRREPAVYLRLGEFQYLPGGATQLGALLLFLPLLAVVAWRPADLAGRGQVAPWLKSWLILAAGYGALLAAARLNLFPRYELYPATLKDPFLERVPWVALLAALAGIVMAALPLRRWKAGEAAGQNWPLAALLGLSAVALVVNHFAAVLYLALPALVWPWAVGRSRAVRIVLLILGTAPFFVLIAFYAALIYVGWRMPFYLLLQAAYGTWSPLTVLMFLGVVVSAAGLLKEAPPSPRRDQ